MRQLDSNMILTVKVKLIRLVNPLEHAPFRLKGLAILVTVVE